MKKAIRLAALCAMFALPAQADVLQTGFYSHLGFAFSTADVQWSTRNGTRLPEISSEATGVNLGFGYDWRFGNRSALGVEFRSINTLSARNSPSECTTGNRSRECTGSIGQTFTFGTRYTYEFSSNSAVFARGGWAQSEIQVGRARTGRPQNSASATQDGHYIGLGYLRSVSDNLRFAADVTRYDFEVFSINRTGNAVSRDVDARATTLSFGLELSF